MSAPVEATDRLLWSVLRKAREAKGLSQTEAAPKIGISQSTLSGLESGRQGVAEDTLIRVARGYGLTLSEMLALGLGLDP